MIRWLITKKLDAAERRLGGSLDYARHILATSLRAFLVFAKFPPVAAYRRRLPADVHAVARLAIVRREDCGECAQIEVNQALRGGVPARVMQAVLDARPGELGQPLADVHAFAEAISEGRDDAELRARLALSYRPEQMVELAPTISTAEVYPRLRRVLGFAVSCRKVEVRVPP